MGGSIRATSDTVTGSSCLLHSVCSELKSGMLGTDNFVRAIEFVDMLLQRLFLEDSAVDSGIQQLSISSSAFRQQVSENISAVESQQDILTSGLEGPLGVHSFNPAPSCGGLPASGYYWVRASDGSVVRVYCDMTLSCGNITGGWMRIAELNMTDSTQQCPSGLAERTDSNIRTCGRIGSFGCTSVPVSTRDVLYSSVCGRIIALVQVCRS